MKKLFLLFTVFLLSTATAWSQTWQIGNPNAADVTATLSNGTLTIRGTGYMIDPFSKTDYPWYSQRADIKTVIIENGVTSLGPAAFQDCSEMTSASIAQSVTGFNLSPFSGCASLVAVEVFWETSPPAPYSLPASVVVSIPAGSKAAYRNGNGNTSPWNDYTVVERRSSEEFYIKDGVLKQYNGSGSNVVIPDGVTEIGSYAFDNCSTITSITIPENVTSIGNNAFLGCGSLSTITVFWEYPPFTYNPYIQSGLDYYSCVLSIPAGTRMNYSSIGGMGMSSYWSGFNIIERRSTEEFLIKDGVLVQYNGNGGNVIIPNNVTEISAYVFENCSTITSITIPSSVTSIGLGAFRGCTNLTSITNQRLAPQTIAYDDAFDEDTYTNATLYVPQLTYAIYLTTTNWMNFANILPISSSSIDETKISLPKPNIVGYYSIIGAKLNREPQKGVYIVVYDNGAVEKRIK